MANDPKLEAYLSALERALRPLPVSERADIITEIKSHVLSALEREPQTPLDSVLRALGEPETVANRYLMEGGHTPVRPPISPFAKWIVAGFLGALAMCLAFVGILVWRFSPIIKISENEDRVTLLGGAIDIDGGSADWKGSLKHGFSGSKTLPADTQAAVSVQFSNGRVVLTSSSGREFTWDCKGKQAFEAQPTVEGANGLRFDLDPVGRVRCELGIPQKARLVLRGHNGAISIEQPRYSADVKLNNGKVSIDPDAAADYVYSLSVAHGKVDSFRSSDKPEAYQIKVQLNNGVIAREGGDDESGE